ncbi:MAG: hypothetical protein JWP25_5034 [Bradyrhizobium sp.]|nr:hypothetical protein [Bradyrhizobium sp.]
MITQLKTSHAKRKAWMERVNQELEGFEKRELKLLADDRKERERMLGMRLRIDLSEFPDQKISD